MLSSAKRHSRRMRRDAILLAAFLFLTPSVSFAQSTAADAPRLSIDFGLSDLAGPDDLQPPIASEPKPTRNFPSALVHNLGDDFKHMPRRNSCYWLGAARWRPSRSIRSTTTSTITFSRPAEGTGVLEGRGDHRVHAAGDRRRLGDLRRRASEEHATRAASRHGRARGGNPL